MRPLRSVVPLLALGSLLAASSGCTRPAANGDVVTLSFWHGMESGVNNEVLEAKLAEFHRRKPRIRIDAQVYGAADQLGPKLDAAVAGRTAPDLLWWAPAFFPKYAEAGVLRSVDDFIASDPEFHRDDVRSFLWEVGSYGGHVYATPFSANNLAVYYNKAMFASAGISELPSDWEGLRAASRKLTRDGVHGFQIPIGTAEWTVWTWQCFLWQAGGEILGADGKAAFNSDAGVEALEFWRALLAEGVASFSETDAGYKTDDFLAGRVGMVVNGPWNYPLLAAQKSIDVGVLPMPGRARAATNSGGESLFLFASEPRRERAAWEFMKFVMSPDFQVDWAIRSGYLPVSAAAAASPRYQAFLATNPFLKVYNDQMSVGRVRPSIPEYPALSATLGKYLEAALYGRYASREALDLAAVEVNRLLP